MTHEEIREIVNAELKKKSLLSLSPKEGDRVSFGLSSGSVLLNLALSGNPKVGYLWGRIVEIYGTESSGKSTLALHVVKEAQEYEKITGDFIPILYCDAENALDPIYAQNIGIDVSKLSVTQPTCFEEALNEIELCIKNGYRLVIVDSVAALVPRAELEGEVGEAHIGLQARLMSQSLRKLTGLISKKEAIVIFINQIRMKIGVFFGNPEVTTGGQALKFYTSYRLDVRAPRSGVVKAKTLLGLGTEETVEVGTNVVVHVVKNKVYPPHRKAEFKIVYGKGIDVASDLISYMELAGLFQQVGKKQVFTIDSKGYSASQLLKEMVDSNEFYYKVKKEVLK